MTEKPLEYWSELQSMVLKTLDNPNGQLLYTAGPISLFTEIDRQRIANHQVEPQDVIESVWSLIRQGLAFMDTSVENPDRWKYRLSSAGRQALQGNVWNLDSGGAYITRLHRFIPNLSSEVLTYAREAERSYSALCYLSSVVMLGVASEAAFLDMANSFATWLGNSEGERFRATLNKHHETIFKKFEEFRRRIEPHKMELPTDIRNGLDIEVYGVAKLIRTHRNEAGHPTGITFDRMTVNVYFGMFPVMLRKMYDLKEFFDFPLIESKF